MSAGTAGRQARLAPRAEAAVARRIEALRLRIAVLVTVWSMTVSALVLAVVGITVSRTNARPLADSGLLGGGGSSGSGGLRDQLRDLTGGLGLGRGGGGGDGLVQGAIHDLKQAYLSRAVTAAIVALVVIGVLSALAGWWLGGHVARATLNGSDASPRSPRKR